MEAIINESTIRLEINHQGNCDYVTIHVVKYYLDLVHHWEIDKEFVTSLKKLLQMMNEGLYDELSMLECNKKLEFFKWDYMQSKHK
jgi:hypothetical protein